MMIKGFKATPTLSGKAADIFLKKITSSIKTYPVPTPKAEEFVNNLLLKLRGDIK